MKAADSPLVLSGKSQPPTFRHLARLALVTLAGVLAGQGWAADPPPGAGTIQFAQAEYTVGEAAGTVTLVATRLGGSSGAVAGYFRTANGTALAGQDYPPTTNVVTWPGGDAAPKNIVLSIVNDTVAESAETFTVTFFTTSGGAILGTPATATVTIADDDTAIAPENHPPILPPTIILTVPKLVELVVTNTATDHDLPAQTLTYALLAKPPGATIDAHGIVRWTPPTASTNYFQTKVTDNGSPAKSATNSFYVIVTEPVVVVENHPPVLPPTIVLTVPKLMELVVTNTATDHDLPAQTLTYALLAKPPGATIDAHGIVRWTPPSASTNYFQTKVTDNGSPAKSATNSFYVIVTEPVVVIENHPPVLPGPPAIFRVLQLMEMVVTNTASDPDLPAQTLTYEFLARPDGATIDAHGIVRWTPPSVSTNYFQTKVTDNGSPAKSATNSFYVLVNEPVVVPENHAPVLPRTVVLHVPKLVEAVVTNTATDSDLPAQTLTYELLASPAGATIAAHGIVRWTPPAVSTNYFQIKVTDNGSPAKSATNSLYIIATELDVVTENHAPVLPEPTVFTIVKLTELVVTNTATDSDLPAQALAYELLAKPEGATIDANGIVRWTPPGVSTNYFQAKVTDNGSPVKSATNSFYVIVTEPVVVTENHPPVLPPMIVLRVPKLTAMVVTNTASDSDLPAQTLTYELLASPTGATINAHGIVRWTPPVAGTNSFQTKVTDNGSPARSATNVLYIIATELDIVAENHTPILPRPSVVTVKKLTEMVFTNTATDYDLPAQTLTYELLARSDGATIDAEGIIRWTPTLAQGPSTNRFRTKVTDNGTPARSATNVFYAIVTEGNTAPVLYGRSSFTVTNGAGFSASYTATDSDTPANTLAFGLVSGPAWLTFTKTDEHHAELTGTPPVVTAETHFSAVLQVMDNGTPPLAKQLTVRITLLAAPPTPAACFVTRRLPAGYVPGTALTVSLLITPPADTTAYTVADAPPAGWTVGAISDAGQRDAGSGAINFGPFTDASARTLTYELTPPATETGSKSFAGFTYRNGAFTGICGADALIQLQYHPADANPADLRLTDAEVTTYAAAWKSGTAWPAGPNPIEVAFVTRAGYLSRNGETYTVNPIRDLPLTWIPTLHAPITAKVPTTLTTAPTGKGCWRFLAHKLAVGATTTVALIVNPAATDFAYAVEEIPPPGWTVGVISADGVYDATTGRVRWGLFQDQTSRTLTYELTPSGALTPFAGVASFDGTNLPITGVRQPEIVPAITEAEFAPATRLPTGEIVLPLATRDGTVTVIEFSDDLRVWTPIWTNTPGSQLFRDLPLNVRAGRFYRSIEQ